MSSTVFVSKKALVEAGVQFTSGECEYSGEHEDRALFPNYPYLRQVDFLHDDNPDLTNIECGGSFRSWLQNFLTERGIKYELA